MRFIVYIVVYAKFPLAYRDYFALQRIWNGTMASGNKWFNNYDDYQLNRIEVEMCSYIVFYTRWLS